MRHISVLLCVLFSASASCKDLKENKSPYTSLITVAFKPQQGGYQRVAIQTIMPSSRMPGISGSDASKVIQVNSNTVVLPLNPDADVAAFALYGTDPTKPHTLTIRYKREVSMISPQGGAQRAYRLIRASSSLGKTEILYATPRNSDGKTHVQVSF